MSEATKRKDEWRTVHGLIREVLSRFGQNARTDSDFHLVEEDLGTYELKVQTSMDELPPGLLEAVMEILWDHGLWTVFFAATNLDGAEVSPPTGLMVSRLRVWPMPPIVHTPEETREVKALYEVLEKLLAARGVSNPFGNGDYWIVDDGWVKHSHKVCIFRIDFLSPDLVAEVQQLLRADFPACVIWFQIEVVEPGVEVPLPGMRVYADRIEQDWDRDLLRSIFKDRFPW